MNYRFLKYSALFACLAWVGCDNEDVRINIPTPPDTMELQASALEIDLKPKGTSDEAVRFSWKPAADRGGKITYSFKIDLEEDNFGAGAIVKYIPEGVTSCSFTYQELYDMMKSWGVKPDVQETLVAEVIARTENPDFYIKPEVSRTEIYVRTYDSKLYLLGPGTTVGDNLENAMLLTEVIPGAVYNWFGWLNGGDIYFPTQLTSHTPAYGRGADNWTVDYYESGIIPCFDIPGMGYYILRVDISDNTFDYYEDIHMIGDGCSAGWYIERSLPFERPDRNERIYTYSGVLNKGGELKFPLRDGSFSWNVPWLMPLEHGTPAMGETPMDFSHTGNPDLKWKVETTGYYNITLNTGAKTARFDCVENMEDLPYTRIWMVGDATPGGWNSDPFQIELTYDITAERGTFVWEGDLIAGEFKFPLAPSTFEVPYLMPLEVNDDGLAPLSETRLEWIDAGGPDKKWVVKSEEAGRYRISINVLKMIVKFERLK